MMHLIMAKRKNSRKHRFRDISVLLISIGMLFGGALILWAASLDIPDFNTFEERKVAQSTKIYDRTGEVLLYDIHQDIKRTVVGYGDISTHLKNATVAIEDAEFYEHKGIKPTAILRAIFANLTSFGFSQGGSTITQQVIKNSVLTQEKKISRKLKEWALAVKLERLMSKEDILTLYLNEAPYGGNIYGAQEASNAFFGKDVAELTLAEAAYLAALPQAPTYYSPYGNNKDKLDDRKNLVLRRMTEIGFITEEEALNTQKEIVEFTPQENLGIKAPHFVFFVRSYLEEKYGKDIVEQGGLKVVTTLDYGLQEKAEGIIKEYALENTEKFNAENAGLIATDPNTGQILVMVGSRDYFDEKIDGNFNITLAHRQPGSAFKPFVYATAFKQGYTPDTVVFDLETQFETRCNTEGKPIDPSITEDACYTPVNYDGVYNGPISLRNALAQSVNIPAIKTLYLAGTQNALQTAKDFGISSLTNVNQYGLTLVLGGGEVSLLEMTNAYGVFANEGTYNPHAGILSVEDNTGSVLEEFSPQGRRVIDENVTRQISDVLSDNDARAPAFGQRSYLYFDERDVAVKTGTTNDYRDAWIIGYTPGISVGTWAGNNDNSPMEKKVAGFIVAPMWNAFMQEVLKEREEQSFRKPKKDPVDTKPILKGVWRGGETYQVDKITGKLATEYTPIETLEERVVTSVHSILYWVDKKNPLGEKPKKPENDPQFNLWEHSVRKWVEKENITEQTTDNIPKEYDNVHKPEFYPNTTIKSPLDSVLYSMSGRITILTESSGRFPVVKNEYYVNDVFIGSSNTNTFSFTPSDINSIKNSNTLRVISYDSVFNKVDSIKVFNVR